MVGSLLFTKYLQLLLSNGFLGGASGKEPACQCRGHKRLRFNRWVRREGHSNPFQYSCLENPMDRGAWWTTIHGVAKNLDTTEETALLPESLCTADKWRHGLDGAQPLGMLPAVRPLYHSYSPVANVNYNQSAASV